MRIFHDLVLISYSIPSGITLVTNFCLFVCFFLGWVFVRGILRLVVRDVSIHAFVVVREKRHLNSKGTDRQKKKKKKKKGKGERRVLRWQR